MTKENMLKLTFDNETIHGVFQANGAIWILTNQRIIEATSNLSVSTLHKFNENLNVSRAKAYGESLYFVSNNSLSRYEKTHGLKEISKIQVTPIDFCVNQEKNTLVYLLHNQLKAITGDDERMIHLSELYRGIQCFERQNNLLLLLIGLWGYTGVNLEGKMEFYKTFGDIVNDVKIFPTSERNYILVGSKNGSFYVGDDKGDIISSVSLGKSLAKFDLTFQSEMFNVIWAGFDGSINFLELNRNGKVEKSGVLVSLELDIENISVTVTENEELLIAASEKNKLVLLKKKI